MEIQAWVGWCGGRRVIDLGTVDFAAILISGIRDDQLPNASRKRTWRPCLGSVGLVGRDNPGPGVDRGLRCGCEIIPRGGEWVRSRRQRRQRISRVGRRTNSPQHGGGTIVGRTNPIKENKFSATRGNEL